MTATAVRLRLSEIKEHLIYAEARLGASRLPRRALIELAVASALVEHDEAEKAKMAARSEGLDLLEHLDEVVAALRRVVRGRGDDHDAALLRGEIALDGALFGAGSRFTVDWHTLLYHRSSPADGS